MRRRGGGGGGGGEGLGGGGGGGSREFVMFLIPPMVMVMVKVMVNGLYINFEYVYSPPAILAFQITEKAHLFVSL